MNTVSNLTPPTPSSPKQTFAQNLPSVLESVAHTSGLTHGTTTGRVYVSGLDSFKLRSPSSLVSRRVAPPREGPAAADTAKPRKGPTVADNLDTFKMRIAANATTSRRNYGKHHEVRMSTKAMSRDLGVFNNKPAPSGSGWSGRSAFSS